MVELLERLVHRAAVFLVWLIFGVCMLVKLLIELFQESPVETAVVFSSMAIGSYTVWWLLDRACRFLGRTGSRLVARVVVGRAIKNTGGELGATRQELLFRGDGCLLPLGQHHGRILDRATSRRPSSRIGRNTRVSRVNSQNS